MPAKANFFWACKAAFLAATVVAALTPAAPLAANPPGIKVVSIVALLSAVASLNQSK